MLSLYDDLISRVSNDFLGILSENEIASRLAIMGGAARDPFFGVPVRDYDVYYRCTKKAFDKLSKDFSSNATLTSEDVSNYHLSHKGFYGAFVFKTLINFNSFEVNLICIDESNSFSSILSDFVCNISKCGYTYKQGLFISKEAIQGKEQNWVKYKKDVNSAYVRKIARKYPKYNHAIEVGNLFFSINDPINYDPTLLKIN